MKITYEKKDGTPDKRYILHRHMHWEGLIIYRDYDTMEEITEKVSSWHSYTDRYEIYDRVEGIYYDIETYD
jgi:pyridoxine/pyridoxamine 5'-phosphate oxidase